MANWLQELLFGTPQQVHQAPTMGPEQMQILQFLMQQGQQGMQNPYTGFEPIAENARAQFGRQTMPSIAERFTAMSGGAGSSPALQSLQTGAKTDLELGLAALQSQYGMQNRNQMMQMLGMGLQPQFQNIVSQGQPGLAQPLLQGLGRMGTGAGLGFLSGGPMGALTGAGLGAFGGFGTNNRGTGLTPSGGLLA